MDRRRFLLTSLAGVLAAPLAAGAQQPKRLYRIGTLEPTSAATNAANLNAFRQGATGTWVRRVRIPALTLPQRSELR